MTATRKLKLLYANAMYSPDIGGGAEIMVKTMAEGMLARGHDVQVLTTHAGQTDRVDEVDGIPVHRLKLQNLYWPHTTEQPNPLLKAAWHAIDCVNPLMASSIREKLKALRPDVLISNNLPGLSISLWREAHALGIPIIQVLHDYYLLCPRATRFKNGQTCLKQCSSCKAFRLPHASASNMVSAVAGVSNSILTSHLEQGLFKDTPLKKTIYNARALPVPPAATSARTRTPGQLLFGFIGALTDVKGIKELIIAFNQLTETNPCCKLQIAGTGKAEFVEELHRLTRTLNIEFLGRVNADDFFAKIDYCITPSKWQDPLPGVVYEAISQNVPVIGSNTGGIQEIIQDGINGTLFDASQPDALLKTLHQTVQRHDDARSRNIRNTVATFLDESRMYAEYEDLILAAHALKRES